MTGLDMLAAVAFVIYSFIQPRVWFKDVPPEYIYLGIGGFIFAGFFRWLGRVAAGEIEEKLRRLDQKTSLLCASGLSS